MFVEQNTEESEDRAYMEESKHSFPNSLQWDLDAVN